ncbi:hypothetical protein Tco_1174610 [Tanacetum coccineum]
MQQKHVSNDSVRDQLLPLSAKYPWLVAQNLGAEEDVSTDQIFCTFHDPLFKYQCQIPELTGKRIRGYYHGWVILSDHPASVMWSLWNPVTSKMINFPPLILKDGDSISVGQCCLLAPPDDPTSILLLTRTNKPTFVFYRLDSRRKKLIWTEIVRWNNSENNGQVVNIVDKGKEVLIKLLLLGPIGFLEGTLLGVHCFKLDMTSLRSEEIERFKDLDMTGKDRRQGEDYSDLGHVPAIASELGCNIYIRDRMGQIMYSCNVKNNTISLSYMPSLVLPTSHVSVWECRLEDGHGEAKCTIDSKPEEDQRVDYSLVSPWLMVADKNQGIMTFTDPLLGNNYFKKTLESLKVDLIIHCSRFGWLLLESCAFEGLYFFNPLTGDLRMLPEVDNVLKSLSFSAPPTSPDCMAVGFSESDDWNVFIHFVAREPSWRQLSLGVGAYSIHSPTFLGRDLYALRNEGELIGFNSKQEWVKVNGVGKHTIYICGITCLCVEAKSMEMENKIYFPRLHSKNNKIVFYSLETCSYQTSNGDNIQERLRDFIGTTYHLSPHLWIEPSWSS